jgi:hypothetical protein
MQALYANVKGNLQIWMMQRSRAKGIADIQCTVIYHAGTAKCFLTGHFAAQEAKQLRNLISKNDRETG